LLKVSHIRLKRSRSLVDIEIDFLGETTGDAALAKLALRIDVAGELVGIAWQVRVIADDLRLLLFATRSRAENDRLQLADLAILERVGRLPEIIREAAGQRQFVKRVDPVRSQIVELPVRVHV
jgi:hypothetical protein